MKSMIENEEKRKDDKGFNEKGGIMKKDKYIKVILTIIAICLVWICVRHFKIGYENLYADNENSSKDYMDVHLAEISHVYGKWYTIKVDVMNWPLHFSLQPE